MTQPARIPIIASDGGVYTAPGEDWDGEPTIVALSTAEEAAGFVPNDPAGLPAEVFNWLTNLLGGHAAALAPLAVDNWPTRVTVTLTGAAANTDHGKIVQSVPGTSRLLVRTAWGGGGATGPWFYSTHTPELDAAADWTLAAAPTLGSWVAAGVKSDALVATVADTGAGNVRYTTDLGATWADGGTLPLGLDTGVYCVHYCTVSDRFIIVGSLGYNTFTRTASAAALGAGGNWTSANASPGGETDGVAPRAIESSPTETLIAWSNGRITRTTDGGVSWTVSAVLPGFSGALAGLSYNASHGLWCALGTTGDTWYSPTGATWTAGVAVPSTFGVGSRVVSFGRYWAAARAGSINNHIWRWDTESSADTYSSVRVSGTTGAIDLHAHTDGRLVAFRPGQFLYSMRLTEG